MLFHHLSNPRSGVDVEQIVCELRHDVDFAKLQEAWNEATRLHPRLRACFAWDDRQIPVQWEVDDLIVSMGLDDLRNLAPKVQEERIRRFLEGDRERGFDLSHTPLFRLTAFRLSERHSRLIWSLPHILMDGWSFPIVLGDVFRIYDAQRGTGATLGPTGSPPFRDFVNWYFTRDQAGEERFWRRYLEGFVSPTVTPGHLENSPTRDDRASAPRLQGTEERLLSIEASEELRKLAASADVSLGTIVNGAWAILLSRYAGQSDVVFGATRACRGSAGLETRGMVGVLINTLPVRVRVTNETALVAWLQQLRKEQIQSREFEHAPLVRVQQWSGVQTGQPLFESLVVFDFASLDSAVKAAAGNGSDRTFRLLERTPFPLALYVHAESRVRLELVYDSDRLTRRQAEALVGRLSALLSDMGLRPDSTLGQLSMLDEEERALVLETWNATARPIPEHETVHGAVLAALARDPGRIALQCGPEQLSAGELNVRSERMARLLRRHGVGPGSVVGVAVPRSTDLVVVLLGVLRAGAAYLPLDPEFPHERLAFMVKDSGAKLVVSTSTSVPKLAGTDVPTILLDPETHLLDSAPPAPNQDHDREAGPADRAYVIYTSGSTGRPKGVEVEHRNVVNFLAAMDDTLGPAPANGDLAFLSLTSLSFDIAVLEIFWTLSRGQRLVLFRDSLRRGGGEVRGHASARAGSGGAESGFSLSLLYFASDSGQDEGDRYRLLLEGARFADTHGFSAVWTPERHFHAFGGLYPNPAVTGAAVAAVTSRVAIRAGSVVLPLHHPLRVVEEWAVVDNLSRGRVGISFASGWHPNDFVLAPDRYRERKEILFRDLEVVRKAWRGEKVRYPGPDGKDVEVGVLPRPVQRELPVWITTAGTRETYVEAGRVGANVLTHLLGQTLPELEDRIQAYREAWRAAGHGPGDGHVSLMLHAFVGQNEDVVREIVRDPMIAYLRTSIGLVRNFADAWTAYKAGAPGGKPASGNAFEQLSPEEMDSLLEFAFERYFETSGLFGSKETCLRTVERLRAAGVDEIACLIDFGVATDTVLAHLPLLAEVLRECTAASDAPQDASEPDDLAAVIRQRGVTHIQCTPSRLRLILADQPAREALKGVACFLVGGEALPRALAADLLAATGGRVLNMYGPTETTVWSTVWEVSREQAEGAPTGQVVPIGRPIANTRCYVLDEALLPAPVGFTGELFIGGKGVARGYLGRPDLNRERFLPDPFDARAAGPTDGGRMYRTGDRARFREDGVLEFLGRTDHQVKLRGHRIELGEIEAALQKHPSVQDAAVVIHEATAGDQRLTAYLVPVRDGERGEGFVGAVRSFVARELPELMVPSAFVVLDKLPLTPNEKVDRKRLLPPADTVADSTRRQPGEGTVRPAQGPGVAKVRRTLPAGRVEETLARIWADVLGTQAIGRDDNFFDLGGHSLLTVQVHGRIRRELGVEIRITDLFRHPTVSALAGFLEGSAPDAKVEVARAKERGALRGAALRRRRSVEGAEN